MLVNTNTLTSCIFSSIQLTPVGIRTYLVKLVNLQKCDTKNFSSTSYKEINNHSVIFRKTTSQDQQGQESIFEMTMIYDG